LFSYYAYVLSSIKSVKLRRGGGEGGGGEQGGEMTQIMYAHVNKRITKKLHITGYM
jgi:hypothetical protein